MAQDVDAKLAFDCCSIFEFRFRFLNGPFNFDFENSFNFRFWKFRKFPILNCPIKVYFEIIVNSDFEMSFTFRFEMSFTFRF